MDNEKQRLSIEAARLYYLSDYSQMEIATRLGVSRPTVSRLLQHAKEQGYVRINIVDPLEDLDALGDRLKQKYKLDTVLVCYSPLNEYQEIQKHISKKAADYLHETVQDADIIGVTWGRTMHAVALQLQQKQVRGVEVVQLKGGVSHSHVNTYAAETVNLFAAAFHTIARYLPLPVIFDSIALKQMVEKDRHIHRIIQLGKQANIAVFTVGTVKEDALLFQLGYFSKEEQKLLQSIGAGDISSRFFDEEGNICSEEINNRTVGIDLQDLCDKEKSILVAGGQRKIEAIRAALVGKYANILVTDQFTAQALL
ncbi:sugar-binding transcriptional regulator [Paenibacillus apiarius]|uniref:Sugar-binding transcriptional regulator n=1 Tax=Paenibacillus apiarius TaxID=46240 RepID=A0ABT4E2F3_9BACL|nr:sugar-binding transcriptional regulator [Paenibacillus apiarius]MCY9516757.1 sugar-binding transcriptional regulator [Paenibacillus apiarius]MCY9523200.1 sugar-binding transcriptional regulator [Paenibacillus apiarius]MCY9553181.1 sugar-binding transcriptional regulator [Paenibacillus apiarius]MCY9559623.1 sugar-binding transcriptional regulator [Paenibacillus apiarius]MCY9686533.1 sugar-binding transcriptional regulator [Paenibacillus apiarius]